MNYNDLIFYDFETGSVNPHRCQPLSLAAIPIQGRKLEVLENDMFYSLIQPIFDPDECRKYNLDPLSDEALRINKLTREELKDAPPLKTVWEKFTGFVNKYNYKGNRFTAPVLAGFNNRRFDDIILNRICGGNNYTLRALVGSLHTDLKNKIASVSTENKEIKRIFTFAKKILSDNEPYGFGPWDNDRNEQTLFHPRDNIDLMSICWHWTENNDSIRNINMDAIREWLGISKEGAHTASQDVLDGARILVRFMRITRKYAANTNFEPKEKK